MPDAVFHIKDQRAPRPDVDLRVEPRFLKCLTSREQLLVQQVTLCERALDKRRGEPMQPRVERIKQDQALPGK